jgi:hypothetical protein
LKRSKNGYYKSSLIGVATAAILLINLFSTYSVGLAFSSSQQTDSTQQKKEQITFRAILTDLGDATRWNSLIYLAMQGLRSKHPNLDIQIAIDANNPYNKTSMKLINTLSNKSLPPIDLISLDQIWLGEFLTGII